MPNEFIQPPELFASEKLGFTQVVTAAPGKLVFVSGQTALDAGFQVIGGDDLTAQAEQALCNLGHALGAAGAQPSDLTSLRIYIAGFGPESMKAIGRPLARFFDGAPPCAQTLLGVQTLAMPELKIEVEATAVVSG